MTRFSTAVLAFTFAVASAPGLSAQTATVFEVNYEVVGIDADGNTERQGEGVHTQHTGDVSIESWWHFTSLSAVDPIKYSPVLMEATFTIGTTGYRHVTKITSARAIPLSADIFMIPYPEY